MDHEEIVREYLNKVGEPDRAAMDRARARQAELAKPPGSLGRLEELAIQLAGITGHDRISVEKKRLLVFAADNGVVEEGVSSAPQTVTRDQTINLTLGKTGAATLARHFGCELQVCDVGVNAMLPEGKIIDRKVAFGTKNLRVGPAMSREEACRAFLAGAELAEKAASEGVNVLGIGEMGIGNTTTSSAILCCLLKVPVEKVTGRGGGITDAAFEKKLRVVREGLLNNAPDPGDPLDVLAKVGGFDIAAMAGAFVGAAGSRVPVVIDGFISVTAALLACRLEPRVREFLIPSHESFEIGYRLAIGEMGLRPLFSLGMRLGEGSGCPIAFQILEAACAIRNEMATFTEAGIDDGYLEEIRQGDKFTVEERS